MEENSYPFSIVIDGARADEDQHWRIYRIHRILGYAQALADMDNNEVFYKKIGSFYDSKGLLFVTWLKTPTENETKYIKTAWESIVTDYEMTDIEHIIDRN